MSNVHWLSFERMSALKPDQEETILVHCAAGISRSVTAVATALAAERDISVDKAVEIVQERRSQASPHPELVDHAQTYPDAH